jgi:hypothetical protein
MSFIGRNSSCCHFEESREVLADHLSIVNGESPAVRVPEEVADSEVVAEASEVTEVSFKRHPRMSLSNNKTNFY